MEFQCKGEMGSITINVSRNEPISTEISFKIGSLNKQIIDNLRVSVPAVPSLDQFLKEVEEAVNKKLKLMEESNNA